jgi:hypothetical protein
LDQVLHLPICILSASLARLTARFHIKSKPEINLIKRKKKLFMMIRNHKNGFVQKKLSKLSEHSSQAKIYTVNARLLMLKTRG